MQRKWTLRLLAALIWAAAAASAGYWIFRFDGAKPVTGTPAKEPSPPADVATREADIGRFLGGAASAGNTSGDLTPNRFSLVGVVASGADGAALLVVDGKPARPYRTGSRIDDNTVLQAVGTRHVVLAGSMDGPPLQRLELRAAAPAGTQPPPEPRSAPVPPAEQAPAAPAAPELRRPDPDAQKRSS